jgi:hypothetical protein
MQINVPLYFRVMMFFFLKLNIVGGLSFKIWLRPFKLLVANRIVGIEWHFVGLYDLSVTIVILMSRCCHIHGFIGCSTKV